MSRRVQSPPKAPKQPEKRPTLPFPAVAALIAVLVLGGLIMLRRQPRALSPAETANAAAAREGTASRAARVNASTAPDSASPLAGQDLKDSGATPAPSPTPEAEPEPEVNAKIDHHIDDFRAYKQQFTDYKLEGVIQTNDGIELARASDAESSDSEGFRRGVIESPTLPMNHPSNAIQPIWRAKIPNADTALRVEVALSADGSDWSKWYPIEPTGDDISPTYPDGRPNPNYGAVSGTFVTNGLNLFPFMRYRVTLTSTDANASPALEEFKITYLDSTAGQGQLANEAQEATQEQPGAAIAATPESTPASAVATPATEAVAGGSPQ